MKMIKLIPKLMMISSASIFIFFKEIPFYGLFMYLFFIFLLNQKNIDVKIKVNFKFPTPLKNLIFISFLATIINSYLKNGFNIGLICSYIIDMHCFYTFIYKGFDEKDISKNLDFISIPMFILIGVYDFNNYDKLLIFTFTYLIIFFISGISSTIIFPILILIDFSFDGELVLL